MNIPLLDCSPLPASETGYAHAPDGSYWVYTETGADTHCKIPGEVVAGNPYITWSYWVKSGDVRLEELE